MQLMITVNTDIAVYKKQEKTEKLNKKKWIYLQK